MKKFKKILALSIAVAMTMTAMTGCSTSGDKTASGDKIIIGGTGPLTGEAASYGISVKQGAEVAVKEVNEAGGVNGMKLELLFEDDEHSEDTMQKAYNKLMDKGMQIFMGGTTSGPTISITKQAFDDNILLLTPSGSAKDCTKYDNAFRICFTDPLQGEAMADYAFNTLKYTKMATLYDNGSDYSKGIAQSFEAKYKALGGTIVDSESFTTGQIDFKSQLTKIKSSNADALFIPTYYQDVAYIATQAKEVGLKIPYLGADGWDGVIAQLNGDTTSIDGSIFLAPFTSNDPSAAAKAFVTKYETAYNAKPDQFAADAYDAIYVIKAAIEKSGATTTDIKTDDLVKAMTQISVDGLTGKMTFDASGEPNKEAKVVEISGGQYINK